MNAESSTTLIRSLQDPAVYAHPAAAIEVLQTHISWVVLAGPYAYKIKKPVDLGFVDFTSLERRRFYCHEEIRLNRRLAPGLYLGVVPIAGTPEAPVLCEETGTGSVLALASAMKADASTAPASVSSRDDAGEPFEYAVKMRQFPQDALLSRVLERGELVPAQIDALAREVAGFHGRIDRAAPGSPFGTPESVFAPVDENFRHLVPENVVGSLRDPTVRSRSDRTTFSERIDGLRRWSEREFAARRDDFAARRRDGFVRECHGDMHLGNMILEADGSITIFDCIEFNESFRWIDVLSETAFVVMDLEDRGRPDLARRFLNAYLELTGDYEGLAVLPFYLAYRALVRAKVACIRLGQPEIGPEETGRLRHEFDSYVVLAEGYTRPAVGKGVRNQLPERPFGCCAQSVPDTFSNPLLMITHGLSGSGKTTGTGPLVEELRAVRIRSDVERKRLFGLDPSARTASGIGEDLYSPEATRRTYARLAECAAAVIRAGFPAIVDATFLHRGDRDAFRRLAGELNVPFVILDFRADDETLRRRVTERQHESRDASEATLEVLAHQLRTREPLEPDEVAQAIAVDSETPDVWSTLCTSVKPLA